MGQYVTIRQSNRQFDKPLNQLKEPITSLSFNGYHFSAYFNANTSVAVNCINAFG